MQKKLSGQSGFSLVEMSIVLVMIGFLVGGILVGQSLIRAAQINTIIGDISRYTQAITDFRDKYQSLPGDMSNAEAFWGSDAACPATPYTATPHTATCNGNGNGLIDGTTEIFRAWQQMANAGLINGSYTGVAGLSSATHHLVGINSPGTALPGSGFDVMYLGYLTANASYFDGNYQLKLGVGKESGSTLSSPLFTAAEAFGLDTKLDDGAPGTGKVMPYKSPVNPSCTTTDVSSTSTYATSGSGVFCALNIIIPDQVK